MLLFAHEEEDEENERIEIGALFFGLIGKGNKHISQGLPKKAESSDV